MHTRTKIVCTIGPAVDSYEKILEMIEAGMNVARINFSHGTHQEHLKTIEFLKRARKAVGRPLAILLDTHGPKIRVGKLPGGSLALAAKQKCKLVAEEGGRAGEIPVHPPEILDAVEPGMKILFDDGYLISQVVGKGKGEATVEFQNGGVLKSGKGVNIPGARVPLPALTPGDVEDLKFGCKHDVDIVAASFIRSARHVLAIKELLIQEGKPEILVVAKIESAEGVEQFDRILQAADGIMVARGDLGVEVDLALVPKLQKMMIRKCIQTSKPVITATQMLESMISNPRPTRAEVSDVANAIYDSTSAVMLSGETAVGKYPIESIRWMHSTAREAEADFDYPAFFEQRSQRDCHDLSSAVSIAAVKTAYCANAKAIFAFTASGHTARLVSRLRPSMPIIAVTPDEKTYQQLAFNWGVIPVLAKNWNNPQDAFAAASKYAIEQGIIAFGDLVVVTAGSPFGKKGTTNVMRVESIGDVLVRGRKGIGEKASGRVVFVLDPEARDPETAPETVKGQLIVIPHCDDAFLPHLKHAAGIILQNGLDDSLSEKYATLVAKTFSIPLICRADGAMSILVEGEEATLDPQKGLVYRGSETGF